MENETTKKTEKVTEKVTQKVAEKVTEKDFVQVTQGRMVEFHANERMATKLGNSRKKVFTALVVEINENSVDLMVFYDESVPVKNIPHKSLVKEGNSYWNWPERS